MPKNISSQMDYRGLEIVADEFTGVFNGTVGGALSGVTALTNSTGATANNTVENVPAATAAVTDTTAASLTSTNAAITALENNVSDLTAKINEIIAALD